MTKHYCDRCGIESKEPSKKRMPLEVASNGTDWLLKNVDLCGDCLWELHLFEQSLLPHLTNIKVSMYKNFMNQKGDKK